MDGQPDRRARGQLAEQPGQRARSEPGGADLSARRPGPSALDTALRFLAQRPRSEQEVRRRLQRAEHPAPAIDAVIAQLKQHALVDDTAFARYWVDQRQTFRPRGARLLRAELRQHGVDSADAETATRAAEPDAERDAYRAAHKLVPRLLAASGGDERAFTTRLAQFLARRGFGWDTIASVASRLWHETSGEHATD